MRRPSTRKVIAGHVPDTWDAGPSSRTSSTTTTGAAAWLTETTCAATVTVPVRGVLAVLASTRKVTPPSPTPPAPSSTSHDAPLCAVHAQLPREASTAIGSLAPSAAAVMAGGFTS